MNGETRTFRGQSLAEVEAKVRAELGDDAVVLRQREGLAGGVGGFFQKRLYEVDAMASPAGEAPAAPAMPELERAPVADVRADFLSQLKAAMGPEIAETVVEQKAASAAADFVPDALVAAARVEEAAAEEAPKPKADPAALAALFAPDVPREPVAWPDAEPEVLPAPKPAPAAEVLPAPVAAPVAAPERKLPAGAARLETRLVERGLSALLSGEVLDEAVNHLLPFSSQNRLKPLVASALARRIPTQPLRGAGGRVVGFVGPGGSGKTRCVARLAHAYAVKAGVPVACLALRAEDDGAELQRLVRPFGVNVHALSDATEARARIASMPEGTLVLVDTPGVSPRAEAELRQLQAELRQLSLDECHLAMPATIGQDAGRDLVEGTRALGVDAMALTHADETERLGTVVELAMQTGLPLSYIGRGTIVTGGLRPALPEELAAAVAA